MLAMGNKKTIEREISFFGRALQTGAEVRVTCRPADPDAGIVFRRVDLEEKPELYLNRFAFADAGQRRTVIGAGAAEVQTVEHFLAALWALEIDNMIVEMSGAELPALDGSAIEFVRLLKTAGIAEQPRKREFIRISEPEEIKEGASSIAVSPGEGFSVSYLIDYPVKSIGREVFAIKLDGGSFEREIAPARTFCLKEEAGALLRSGFGQGADLKNTLVMDDDGPIGTSLRFPEEPVRHKILDLVGDFYLLGRPILGKVVAERSGHSLNTRMMQKIYERYVRK
jgi:UDP-3-O-acyl N-acetylglucosamine deacetylase